MVDIPEAQGPVEFSYDEEWLAIVRATYGLFSLSREQKKVPEDSEIMRYGTPFGSLCWIQRFARSAVCSLGFCFCYFDFLTIRRISEELQWVKENVSTKPDGLRIPNNFVMTAPPHHPDPHATRKKPKPGRWL